MLRSIRHLGYPEWGREPTPSGSVPSKREARCVYCQKPIVTGHIVKEIVTSVGYRLVPVHGYRCADALLRELHPEAAP